MLRYTLVVFYVFVNSAVMLISQLLLTSFNELYMHSLTLGCWKRVSPSFVTKLQEQQKESVSSSSDGNSPYIVDPSESYSAPSSAYSWASVYNVIPFDPFSKFPVSSSFSSLISSSIISRFTPSSDFGGSGVEGEESSAGGVSADSSSSYLSSFHYGSHHYSDEDVHSSEHESDVGDFAMSSTEHGSHTSDSARKASNLAMNDKRCFPSTFPSASVPSFPSIIQQYQQDYAHFSASSSSSTFSLPTFPPVSAQLAPLDYSVISDWSALHGPYRQGEIVKHRSYFYRAVAPCNSAEPGHWLAPFLFRLLQNPDRLHWWLICFQLLVMISQLCLLVNSTHGWSVYGVMLLFNYPILWLCVQCRRQNLPLFRQFQLATVSAAWICASDANSSSSSFPNSSTPVSGLQSQQQHFHSHVPQDSHSSSSTSSYEGGASFPNTKSGAAPSHYGGKVVPLFDGSSGMYSTPSISSTRLRQK